MAVKDLTFLQDTPFFNGGIFDNQQVYENTTQLNQGNKANDLLNFVDDLLKK